MEWILGLIAVVLLVAVFRAVARPAKPPRHTPASRNGSLNSTTSTNSGSFKRSLRPQTDQGWFVPLSPSGQQPPLPRTSTRTTQYRIEVAFDTDTGTRHIPPATPEWRGADEPLTIGGRRIPAPLTYLTAKRQRGKPAADPSQIDPELPIAAKPDLSGLPYWPRYERMTPGQRASYLDWMTSGRQGLPVNDGHLFTFYYGLERRSLVDEADLPLVVREVVRLRRLHAKEAGNGRSWSFQHYSGSLLWFLVARDPDAFGARDIESLASLTTPLRENALRAALGWYVKKQQPCPPWLAQTVADSLPQTPRSVVTKRVPEEFATLFAKRYRERFGEGITLRASKRPATASYTPASAALKPLTLPIPDALGIPSQFKPLADIWNSCLADLRTLSKVAMKGSSETLTVEAWEALPRDLRRGTDHPLTPKICALIAEHADDNGHVFLPASALAAVIGLEDRPRYTQTQSRRIVETLAAVGYDLEPDARMHGSYKATEMLTPIIRLTDSDPDPGRFLGASTMLRLGLAVALADGNASEDEVRLLTDEIERMFDLAEHEERRLEALRGLLLRFGSDPTAVGGRIREGLSVDARRTLGDLLIAIAAVDGVIDPSERRALRQCFRALGLEPILVEERLRDLARDPQTAGRAEDPRGVESDDIALDRDAILAIKAETREAALLLAEALGAGQEPDEPSSGLADPNPIPADPDGSEISPAGYDAVTIPAPITAAASGPPARYASFFAVLQTRPVWRRADLEAHAREGGHMLAGAVEALNDWAYDAFGSPLIHDEGEEFHLDIHLLREKGA